MFFNKNVAFRANYWKKYQKSLIFLRIIGKYTKKVYLLRGLLEKIPKKFTFKPQRCL